MKVALVTGGSRGLGAAMVRLLRERDYFIYAPTRDKMDVVDSVTVSRYARILESSGVWLNVLINNAAIVSDSLQESLYVNTLGPHGVTKAFWPMLVRAGNARVINISSTEGLMANAQFGGRPYSVSKTALNALTRMQAKNQDGVVVNACCPGWFRSRLGGDNAPQSAAEAADTPLWLATEAPASLNGCFVKNREVVPW